MAAAALVLPLTIDGAPMGGFVEVCPACDLGATETKDAQLMTALAVIAALVTALWVGYYFGRRGGDSRPRVSWERRTSRTALGRLAIALTFLVVARRIRRNLSAERVLALATHPFGLKLIGPSQFSRRSSPRRRPRWT